MNSSPHHQFIEALQQSLKNASFIKLTLSSYKGSDKELKNIYAREILIKNQPKISFTYRYKTRDIVKNYDFLEAQSLISKALEQDFNVATLFTSENDFTLDIKGFKKNAPTQIQAEATAHDRQKNRLIEGQGKAYLHALGITDERGNVHKTSQDKFKQINKYVEIMSSLVKSLPKDKLCNVIDMGSGKGYLTFALYDYLTAQGYAAQVTGVEYREDLVNLCNDIARQSNFTGLKFVQSSAADYDCADANIMIALHACDTATDDAIYQGIQAGAEIIVVAPCCHKQIRREIEKNKHENNLDFLMKHGIFIERQAEMVTDGLRALMLEYSGYSAKVFEFISGEHTAKNIMIVGIKDRKENRDTSTLEKIKAAKTFYGISSHYLEKLLKI